jgi:lysophospholipase L1-like esterase
MSARNIHRIHAYRIGLVAIGVIVALLVCESVLRLVGALSDDNKFYVYPPHLERFLDVPNGLFEGVGGTARFYINSAGIRGDEFSEGQGYRILAMGGSTTECLYLDHTEAWPYLVQQKLNARGAHAWVGNIGRSGRNTRDYIMQMKYLLPQYPRIDAVIMLVGANDFMMRLRRHGDYDPLFLQRGNAERYQINRAFSVVPFSKRSRGIMLWEVISRTRRLFSELRMNQNEAGTFQVYMRAQRKRGEIVAELPDLQGALNEYARNLNTIIDVAQAQSIRLIFLTQPFLWKDAMTQREQDSLWMGWIGSDHKRFCSVPALRKGMGAYNGMLRQVCRARGVECIDVAGKLKDTAVFYDDLHFNEHGAERVAEIISDYMRSREPRAGNL